MAAKTQTFLICLLLTVIGAAFKFFTYPDVSLWLDEAYSIFEAQKSIAEIIERSSTDQNPPLYFITLHYWVKLFGITEVAARSLSLLFSVLTAPLLFLVLRKPYGFGVAIISALLFTVSDIHFYYSMEARCFAMVSFLAVLSYGLFIKLFERLSVVLVIALAVVNAMLPMTHYISVFVPATQFILALFFFDSNRSFFKSILIANVITGMALIPLATMVLNNLPEEGVYWLAAPGIKQLIGVFVAFTGSKLLVVLIAIIGLLWFGFNFTKLKAIRSWQSNEQFKLLLPVAWLIIPIVLDLVLSTLTPIFLNRYLLYASFGLFILTTKFLTELPFSKQVNDVLVVGLLVVSFLTIDTNISKQEDWRGAVEKLTEHRTNNETVLGSAWYTYKVIAYYHDRAVFEDNQTILDELEKQQFYFANDLSEEEFLTLPRTDRMFMLLGHYEDADPDSSLLSTALSHYDLVETQRFEKVKLLTLQHKDNLQ